MVKTHVNLLVEKGYAEKVGKYPEDVKNFPADQPCFYIPLHPTQDKRKPEKRRITHDCAAKTWRRCLNDFFYKGPDLAAPLLHLLLRFRLHRWTLMGDVGDFFMRVKLPEKHRNAFRFLFWEDDPGSKIDIIRMIVHLFGAKPSSCVATFALQQCARDNAPWFSPEAIIAILEEMYVDDFIKSIEEEDDGLRLIEELTQICSRGGFQIGKWLSNSKKIMESIPEDKVAKSVKKFRTAEEKDAKLIDHALGMKYEVEEDVFSTEVAEKYLKNPPTTRRQVLGLVHSIFDPLGLKSPFILTAKRELQRFGQLKLGWDDPIPAKEMPVFTEWFLSVPTLVNRKVPRWIGCDSLAKGATRRFLCFSDASKVGISACCYVRFVDDLNVTHVRLVTARSHVIPANEKTSCLHGSTPRAELVGAVKAKDMALTISEAYKEPMENFTFWTDSSTVIRQIVNPRLKLETFVRNRVAKILDVVSPTQVRFVPGEINPADIGSRGIKSNDEENWDLFQNGPPFLLLPPDQWPVCPFGIDEEEGKEEEEEEEEEEKVEASIAASSLNSKITHFVF